MSGADTIAAIATAPGPAGVAVVRVSGPAARTIAERLTGRVPEPGRVRFVRLRAPETSEVLDEAVLLTFAGPQSYTGEDVVEFQGHGGAVSPRRILEACLRCGARLARRGEFTARAFLNGKLDYDQAESVLDLIEAKTARAAAAALEGLAGRRARALRTFYEEALRISTELEHALDVEEAELPPDFLPRQRQAIEGLRQRLVAAVRTARCGRILRAGALVVLAGPPNAGKSSLLNALLRENRAIVSATPGTTRDTLEEWMDLRGWPVRLTDTAGLRDTADAVEAEGVRRAEALIARADIVLRLASPGEPVRAESARELTVYAKSDLFSDAVELPAGALRVSVKTGEGLADLEQRLADRLAALSDVASEAEPADASRLAEVLALLDETAACGEDPVLLGNCIRRVAERLGELIGAVYSADLLDRLFSRFCVGK